MRRDFPQSMPVWEQLLSVGDMQSPGRKHQHRKGVKAKQRVANTAKASAKVKQRKADLWHTQVRAYWLGLRETYPDPEKYR